LAKRLGAIDKVATTLEPIAGADLVILAAPINTIMEIAPKISGRLNKKCLVIDVGSTKNEIVSKLNTLIPGFVGCHPLAGSEKKGIVHAQKNIFAGSLCVITPNAKTQKSSFNKAKLLWQKLGAKILVLSPKKHDQILSFTSHLPHVIAFSLTSCIPDKFFNISSGGLKDVTRISGSDASLWSEIFLSNRQNLLRSISTFQTKLAKLKLALRQKDKRNLKKILSAAKTKRERLG